MSRLYTLKVYPAGLGRSVYREIAISGRATLDQLCLAILDAYDFIHEHMYEFCMDNRMYSEYSYQSDPEPGQRGTKITLDKLGLVEKQVFSLHYDFGDDWMFAIKVLKIEDIERVGKPEVLKAKGSITQYPDWEDEEDGEY